MTYGLPVTCLHCGGELAHVVGSRPLAGTECSAIAGCGDCGRRWQVIVHLRPAPGSSALRARRYRERRAAR